MDVQRFFEPLLRNVMMMTEEAVSGAACGRVASPPEIPSNAPTLYYLIITRN